MIKKQRLNKQ